jgi:hypothetical protein
VTDRSAGPGHSPTRCSLVPGSALLVSHVVDDGDGAVSAATRRGAAVYSEAMGRDR